MRGNGLPIRHTLKIKGRLSRNEILQFTEGRSIEKLSQHELGDIGEKITKDIIIPKVAGISKVQQLDLKGVSGVPFDIIATYREEIWLIETKTGKSNFESVRATQKKRMKIILEMLAQKGIDVRPILVEIKLESGNYRLRNFPIKYEEKGLAPTFERIVEGILKYQRTKS